MDFNPNIGIPADPAANEYRLRHVGRISYSAFQGTVGALFGIAVLVVIARVGIRIHTRCQLRLDDYCILFGLFCLCAATGVLLSIVRELFLAEALGIDSTIKLTTGDIQSIAEMILLQLSFRSLAWTTIVCIKFSFLALFHLLIRRLPGGIRIYYWVVVVCTSLAWLFLVSVDWFTCRNFGTTSATCMKPSLVKLMRQMAIVSSTFDILTDIMIISIPVFILQKSLMFPMQKIGVYIFLCLSIVMIASAIIRKAGYRPPSLNNPYKVDITWISIWLYIEACTAIIMGSMTAFRSLFTRRVSQPIPANIAHKQTSFKGFSLSRGRLLGIVKPDGVTDAVSAHNSMCGGGWEEVGCGEEFLPHAPQRAHTGIKTYIYHNDATSDESTISMATTPMRSQSRSRVDVDGGRSQSRNSGRNQIYVDHSLEIRSCAAKEVWSSLGPWGWERVVFHLHKKRGLHSGIFTVEPGQLPGY